MTSHNGGAFNLELDKRYNQSKLAPAWTGWEFKGWYDADGKELNCVNLKETTYYAKWLDVTDPTITVASTNNVAASQTVTLKMSDGQSGIAGYYCGTANPATTAVTYTAFTGSQIDYQVTGNGTYYFSAKDAAGNVATKTLTFYKIMLNANGGSCSTNQLVGLSGNNISLPAATRTGYTYHGWATGSSATSGITATRFTANQTLYATWTVNYYTLSFNVNATDASCSPLSKSVAYGNGYGSLPTPMKAYCIFDGWFTAPSGGSQVSAATIMGAGDATVYAHWTYPNYTLTFDATGGTCSEASRSVRYQSAYGALPAPSRTGYTFTGWFKADGSPVYATTIMDCNGTTIYAGWTINSYTLYFDASGGSCSEGSRVITYGAAYGALPTPSRSYYDFVGWYTAASGGSQVSSSTTIGAGNVTVYAHWTPKNYTLTFNATSGSCSQASKTVAYGAAYGALPEPTKSGADFAGWYTAKSGGSQVSPSTTMGGGNTTVYAHWSAIDPGPHIISSRNGFTKVTVTLPGCNDYKNCRPLIYIRENNSSGAIIAKLVKEIGSTSKTYTLSADLNPSKTYYVEAGWYAETNVQCNMSTCPHYKNKVTAKWTYE